MNHHLPLTERKAHHHAEDAKVIFGFWIYIMSDCLLFASIFATYAVLHNNVFGGPSARELFSLPFVLIETMLLLTSSFTYGMAMLAAHKEKKVSVISWLVVTFVLGAAFLCMELSEFGKMISEGSGPGRSAFLSAFFTLVGTHGAHVLVGLMWMSALIVQVYRYGVTNITFRKLTCLSLFWHFLDIVWIFVFTIVYLMGVI